MGQAKDIIVRPIAATDARRIIKSLHYSHTCVNNSQLHFGVFLNGRCGGALQFGPSLDKRKLVGLVEGTLWNEFIELNRMALAEWLPKNSESRSLSCAMRILRRQYPHLKWVVSFADACQSGDGTIYRASGFVLTGIKVNDQIWEAPGEHGGLVFSRASLTGHSCKTKQAKALSPISSSGAARKDPMSTGAASMRSFINAGWTPKPGYQLRYIYFLDRTARERLTVPILPFSEIERVGAGMYRGHVRVRSVDSDAPVNQTGEGGASPTRTLS